jgi:hypothetical protein
MKWIKLNQRYRVKWQEMKLKETKEYIAQVLEKKKRLGQKNN